MILRLAAFLAVLVGIGGLGGYLHLIGKTPFASLEARHLRAQKERRDPPRAYEPMTLAAFAALPRGASVGEYSAIERRGASLEGYVQRMQRASDGDIHLELVERPPADEKQPYVTAEIATPHEGRGAWSWSTLEWTFRPWRSPAMDVWNAPPARVRISGWLLYDFQHEPDAPSVAAWEIHPVTAIDVWNEDAARWERLAR